MGETYDYRNCQSLFGYAQGVHERSGAVCQLCGCGGGAEIDFNLWRQLTVEHLVGASQGGYDADVRAALAERFPDLSANDLQRMAFSIDEANTVTACSFCNSTTSRHRAPKTIAQVLDETRGSPEQVVAGVVQYLGEILERKKRDVSWKLDSVRAAFSVHIEPALRQARLRSESSG